MAFPQEFYLEDFDEYANERFPDEYNDLRTCQAWTMKFKTINAGIGPLKRVPMLLVGRYFFSSGGRQNAWAWANGNSIHYYHAHCGDEIVNPIGDLLINKVYYNAPLVWATGPQDTLHGMTKCRQKTKALAELVINFVFLLEDRILSVPNPGNTDLLSDFEYACRMFDMRRVEDGDNPRDEYFPYYGDAYGQAGARGSGPRKSGGSSTSSPFSHVKDEPRDDDAPSGRLSGSPYRSTPSSASKKATSTKPHGTPGRSRPSVHIKKERQDDEKGASVSWFGSSYASTPSRPASTPYLGMFTPNASTIRSGSGTSDSPFRLPQDRVTIKPRVSMHNQSSGSSTSRASSQPRRTSSMLNPPAQHTVQGPDLQPEIKIEPNQDRHIRDQPTREDRRRRDPSLGRLTEQAQDTRVADRILALERGLHKRRREVEEPRFWEERAAQRIKVKQEAEEAGTEEVW